MKFERLGIERFGHFESLDLDLRGPSGLVVVYGPNEAGKTTLLRAIHGLLFGIDERSAYGFRYPYQAMAIRATLVDSAGQRLEVTRRKKRKDALLGAVRSDIGEVPLDEPRFARYFGGVTPDLYKSMFGFTHTDLQQGAEVLKVAGLAELLGGGALGGGAEAVRRVLAGLRDEADALFKGRGKNPPINRNLAALRDTRAALRDATFQQPQYLALTQALREARDIVADADVELARLRLRSARVHTLLATFEDFHAHQRLVARLADPELHTPLRPADAERAPPLIAELRGLQQRYQTLGGELDRLERRAAQHPVDHALLAEAPVVERLFRRIETVTARRRELPREHARLERERTILLAELARLSATDPPPALASARSDANPTATDPPPAPVAAISPAELEQVRLALSRWQRARQELQVLVRGAADDEADLSALIAEAATLTARLPDEQGAALLAELESVQSAHAELERGDLELLRLTAEIDLALARLHPRPAAALDRLPLPSFAAVQDMQSRRLDLDRERRDAQNHLSQQTAELSAAEAELGRLAAEDLPDPARLADLRRRRDDAWALVRHQLLSKPGTAQRDLFDDLATAHKGTAPAPRSSLPSNPDRPTNPPRATGPARDPSLAEPAGHGPTLPCPAGRALDEPAGRGPTPPRPADRRALARGFERALADADQLVDRLRADAERLAQRTALAHAAERARLALARAHDRLAAQDTSEQRWAITWAALWEPTRVAPTAPGSMLAWLGDAASLRDLATTRLRHEHALAPLRPLVADFTARLRAHLGDPAVDRGWPALVQQLRERERGAQTLRGRLESLLARRAALESALARTRTAVGFRERDLEAAATDLQRRTAAFGLAADLDPETAVLRLEALADLGERLAINDQQHAATGHALAALADFDAEVAALLARLDRARLPPRELPPQLRLETSSRADPAPASSAANSLELVDRRDAAPASPRARPPGSQLDPASRLDITPPGLPTTPEQHVEALSRALAEARAAASTQALARDEAADRRREHARLAAVLADALAEYDALVARAGVDDEAALLAMSERTLLKGQLERSRADLDLRLARALGEGTVRTAYEAELLVTRREALVSEQDALARQISEVDQRRLAAALQKGRREHEAQQLGGDRAARLGAELEVVKSELEEQIDRYILVHLAERVLDRVTDRYARENQPSLLQYTSELLARITGGRHVRVVVQPETRSLATVDRNGQLRAPADLSSGTCEQLFLALRLAYVLDLCDRSEPLPVILDDVLVNFDDERAAASLAALRDAARATQVILLTCHGRWLDLARRVAPDAHIVELPPDAPAPRLQRPADA